jgi:hypothetical protein
LKVLLISKIIPSFFTIKEGSTSLTKPLSCPKREDVTALRCSEPLRFMVGGPSKVFAIFCGMGPLGERCFLQGYQFKWSFEKALADWFEDNDRQGLK